MTKEAETHDNINALGVLCQIKKYVYTRFKGPKDQRYTYVKQIKKAEYDKA